MHFLFFFSNHMLKILFDLVLPGWYRAEVIGALTSVILIWVVTGILVYLAVQRILMKSFEIDVVLMLITSAIGAVVNLM